MILRSLYILLVLTAWLPLRAQALNNGVSFQIPAAEYNALVDLYASTAGANWKNQTGWTNANATSWQGAIITGVQYDGSGNVLVQGHVVTLVLGNNQLIGTIPNSLGNLSSLQSLYLPLNQLTGSVPSTLGSLSQLQTLDLDHNQLTGSIPGSLGSLSQLQNLDLSQNQLTGSIPATLGSLTQLQNLMLNHNQLTGPIPTGLGSLSQLITLSLDDNQLTGSIPGALGSLSQLKNLGLSGNHVTGTIPTALGNLSQLGTLDLQDTLLSGDVPDFTAFMNVTLNLDGSYLNVAPGSQSLANINAMIAAGNIINYLPQFGTYLTVTVDHTNRFGFTITGPASVPITVRATTNLALSLPTWPIAQSCTLTNGSIHFSDPQPPNYPARFYRISSP